ncbi:hypothetical protein [Helicobacter sp. 11S02629-2]|uniref:hypothetical protein n=1 Tax=Helicobacter sp. 11S02629-2 TaxID=1476195 RepID=UPI000BA4F6FC|nr:hypothetical protein [Helicobacter sp. 11S02629-2]PAF42882.1 hypothetical protein BKH40_07395 [Helicobacter sp. 11S02629-2]
MKPLLLSSMLAFILIACAHPIASFSSISIAPPKPITTMSESFEDIGYKPLHFEYKCEHGGKDFLYTCQFKSLKSTYNALKSGYKHIKLRNWQSSFDPKTNIMTIEVEANSEAIH